MLDLSKGRAAFNKYAAGKLRPIDFETVNIGNGTLTFQPLAETKIAPLTVQAENLDTAVADGQLIKDFLSEIHRRANNTHQVEEPTLLREGEERARPSQMIFTKSP